MSEYKSNDFLEESALGLGDKQKSVKIRLQLLSIRTALSRCHIAQSAAREREQSPWLCKSASPSLRYYVRIREMAEKAQKLAKTLGSRDLQARCEYWMGRAYGGMRDWPAAAEHFALARKLDIPDEIGADGTARLRGLKACEKDDVAFLEEYSKRCQRKWLEEMPRETRVTIEHEAERTKKPLHTLFDWGQTNTLIWQPDHDRVAHAVNRDLARLEEMKHAKLSAANKGGKVQTDGSKRTEQTQNSSRTDQRIVNGPVLNSKELYYIRYGKYVTEKPEAAIERASLLQTVNTSPERPVDKQSPLSSPPSNPKDTLTEAASSEALSSLEDELDGAGWGHEPESLHAPSTSPSTPVSRPRR